MLKIKWNRFYHFTVNLFYFINCDPWCLIAGAGAAKRLNRRTLTYTDLVPPSIPWLGYWWLELEARLRYRICYGAPAHGRPPKRTQRLQKTPFENNAWIPPDLMTGNFWRNGKVKKKPMQIILHLRKGVMWQEKPLWRPGSWWPMMWFTRSTAWKLQKGHSLYMDFVGTMETGQIYRGYQHGEWCADWHYAWAGYYDGIQAPEQEKARGPKQWQTWPAPGPICWPIIRIPFPDLH